MIKIKGTRTNLHIARWNSRTRTFDTSMCTSKEVELEIEVTDNGSGKVARVCPTLVMGLPAALRRNP